jgi:hypothetical protein
MYKLLSKPHKRFATAHGIEYTPVATLTDKFGGVVHIIIDDGCYMCYLYTEETGFTPTFYLFPELHEALASLPKIEVNT